MTITALSLFQRRLFLRSDLHSVAVQIGLLLEAAAAEGTVTPDLEQALQALGACVDRADLALRDSEEPA